VPGAAKAAAVAASSSRKWESVTGVAGALANQVALIGVTPCCQRPGLQEGKANRADNFTEELPSRDRVNAD
jgi:hypothetical protein